MKGIWIISTFRNFQKKKVPMHHPSIKKSLFSQTFHLKYCSFFGRLYGAPICFPNQLAFNILNGDIIFGWPYVGCIVTSSYTHAHLWFPPSFLAVNMDNGYMIREKNHQTLKVWAFWACQLAAQTKSIYVEKNVAQIIRNCTFTLEIREIWQI